MTNKGMDDAVKEILEENDLIIKQIPDGSHSMMRAISNCLYFSSGNAHQIQDQCVLFLKQMVEQKKVPDKLNSFTNNITLFKDFILEPSKFDYHKVNLELVSLLFETKVQVYFISEDNILNSFIINNRYKRKIEMFYSNNHYDSLFSRKFMQLITISQKIVLKIVDDSLDLNRKYGDAYVNFEYENWLNDRIELLNENYSEQHLHQAAGQGGQDSIISTQGRIKRAHSQDNFNLNSLKADDTSTEKAPEESGTIFANPEADKSDVSSKQSECNSTKHGPGLFLQTSKPDLPLLTADRKQILSPVFFVKSLPPGISPKPQFGAQGEKQKFDWKLDMDTIEDCEGDKANKKEQKLDSPLKQVLKATIPKQAINVKEVKETKKENTRGLGLTLITTSSQSSSQTTNVVTNTSNVVSGNTSTQPSEKPIGHGASTTMIQRRQLSSSEEIVDCKVKAKGTLKFFDEKNNFGFFIKEDDQSEIFVHFDDLEKAGVTKDEIKESLEKKTKLCFEFNCMKYVGRYKESKKAVDIVQLSEKQSIPQTPLAGNSVNSQGLTLSTAIQSSSTPTAATTTTKDTNSNPSGFQGFTGFRIEKKDSTKQQTASSDQKTTAAMKRESLISGFSQIVINSQKNQNNS